ncbi:MAG TPA: Crp/Fnr family transcriptional regulator [Clostridiaceae bacterium]|jgi:CRP-like cAMP-binding protein|nr:Crp/Fnr family transcriptional regulator [Clostridiaceae bacterium]
MNENYIKALLKCKLFNNIEIDDLEDLVSCLKPVFKCFTRNSIVVHNGDPLEGLGIILEGEAVIFKESISGNRLLIKNIGEGELFGEVAAFAGKKDWPALVQAITPLTVCFIPKDRITAQCSNACKWHNTMINNMLELVSQRALMLSKKLEYISIKTMRSKLCTYIYEQFRNSKTMTVMLPLNRAQLADFLNVSRPSMSRELARMRDEGIIDYHLSTVKILDMERLKSYCE